MAELWEWEEAYILFQTAVMDESTARKKSKRRRTGGGSLRVCLHYLKHLHAEFGSIEISSQ